MVTAFHPQHINGAQAAKSKSGSPSREIWSWRCRRMSSFRTSPTNRTSSTRWVTTCSLLDASQNTRRRKPTSWLRKQQCNWKLRRPLSSWPTVPIRSSCYATTQIQMASNCLCSVRHGGQRRRTASGISKSPKMSWLLTSATTSCSYTRYWGATPHSDSMISEKDCRWRDSPAVGCWEKAELVCKKDATVDDAIDAGEAALVCMFSGKEGDSLVVLRYAKFCDKVATNKVLIRPQTLPPISAAPIYRNMRVYLQVQQRLVVCNMKERDWGWMTKDENVVPVMTFLPPAPDELLRVIRCNCTTDCSTARCSCRMHSLECSPACGQCRCIGCANSTAADISNEDNDDDEDDR